MIDLIRSIPNYEELTAGQIADSLRATGVTQRAIDLGDLLFLLNNRGMLVRLIRPADSGEKWSGSLVNLINLCNDTSHPLATHVNQFFSHITNDRNKTFDTRQREYAGLFMLIVSTFAGQPTMPTMEDFAAIADLGGGWIYGNVTASEVDAALAEVEKQAIIDATRESIADQLRPLQVKKTNIDARLDAVKLSEYTEAELQEYCDSLLTSGDGNPSQGGE